MYPEVGARTHGADVTRFGATDLGSDVSSRAQQGILGGVDVAGTSAPQILAPTSTPERRAWILNPRPSFLAEAALISSSSLSVSFSP